MHELDSPPPASDMFALVERLFPICRSITGDGARKTHAQIRELLPELVTHEVPSGTAAFDWTVPDEWNIRDAYIEAPNGERVVSLADHNLHVLGYSEPVDQTLPLSELQEHLYSLPDQPTAIPYITSYYARRWGFCLTHEQRERLVEGNYRVKIDSTLAPGSLTYSDLLVPGESAEEVLFSTYTCHPSMANNELSGPAVTAYLARWVQALKHRRYSYRFVFLPETIGSIVYLSRNLDHLKRHVEAGWVVTCVGDDRAYGLVPSRRGTTLADAVSKHVLKHHAPAYEAYTFMDRGSDERQYCSPRVDLPVASITRSKYGTYPEYHTSLDDLSLVNPAGLSGAFEAYRRCVVTLEHNHHYRAALPCEPNLGKRGLYPTLSRRGGKGPEVRRMVNLLAMADGAQDFVGLAELVGAPSWELVPLVQRLVQEGLLTRVSVDHPQEGN